MPNRREADIPAQLAFWLDEHSPQYRKLNALTGEEKGRDKIALWYQEKENIEYILGPIVESFDNPSGRCFSGNDRSRKICCF